MEAINLAFEVFGNDEKDPLLFCMVFLRLLVIGDTLPKN
jgi:hypothetical protein